MDSEKWRNQQIELARARKWRAEREKQVEHEKYASESNAESHSRMELWAVCATMLICGLVGFALALAWYADKLGWAK